MSISSVKFDVNPQLRPALEQLGVLLRDYHYSEHCAGRILAYTAIHGTPSLCPELDVEDEHDAELVFVASLSPIPYDSPAWDDDGAVLLDVGMLLAGVHPFPIGEPDEATLISHEAPDGPNVAAKMIRAGVLPVSGGSPEPFVPTEADWADYRRHFDKCEPLYGYE
jgi:hypothetical protein